MCGLIGCVLACALAACAEARLSTPPEAEARSAPFESMQQTLSRSSRDLRVERMPRGVRKISLQGRFQHVAVVERAAGSSVQRACLDRPLAGF
jgi:hypothetical protein